MLSTAQAADKESAFDRVMRTGVLRCGIAPWPPYFEVDANTHKVTGKAKPFYDMVADFLDLKIEYVELNYAAYVEDMKSGKVDAFCNDGPYTISLARQVDYSTPWLYAPIFVYGRAEDAPSSMAKLNRQETRFVGMDGDLSVDLKNRLFPKAKIISSPQMVDPSQMLMDVATKKADAYILDVPAVNKFNATNKDKIVPLIKDPVSIYPVGMSVLKGEDKLLKTLNTATEMAINMGIADKILYDIDPTGKALYPVAKPYKAPK